MAEQADVLVRNATPGVINLKVILPNLQVGRDVSIPTGGTDTFPVLDSQTEVVIDAATELAIYLAKAHVTSKVAFTSDFFLNEQNRWNLKFKINPSLAIPELPTTMNVSIGVDDPTLV